MAWQVIRTLWMNELRRCGCARIKVTDPMRVAAERVAAEREGLALRRTVQCQYRYPWLYVVLGDESAAAGTGLKVTEGTPEPWRVKGEVDAGCVAPESVRMRIGGAGPAVPRAEARGLAGSDGVAANRRPMMSLTESVDREAAVRAWRNGGMYFGTSVVGQAMGKKGKSAG